MTLEGRLPVADAVPALPRAVVLGASVVKHSTLIQAELGGMFL